MGDDLDWNYYLQLYCYGLRRFVLQEENAFCPTVLTKVPSRIWNNSEPVDATSSSDEDTSDELDGKPSVSGDCAGCFPRSLKDASSGNGSYPSWIRRVAMTR